MGSLYFKCSDCGEEFEYTDGEQEFYIQKGFNAPKRCSECRTKKKKRMESFKNKNEDRG